MYVLRYTKKSDLSGHTGVINYLFYYLYYIRVFFFIFIILLFFQKIKELESDNISKMAELGRLRQEMAELQAMLQNHLMMCPSLLIHTG